MFTGRVLETAALIYVFQIRLIFPETEYDFARKLLLLPTILNFFEKS